MTDSTKHSYRKRVMTLAAKAGLSETDFVRSIYEKARNGKTERTRHIGAYLFCPASCRYAYLYFTLLGLFTLGIVLGLCRYSLWAILLLFPVWEVVKTILDRLFARFVPVKELPRLEIKELSDNDGVLTVITTLLTGEKNDEVQFSAVRKHVSFLRHEKCFLCRFLEIMAMRCTRAPRQMSGS